MRFLRTIHCVRINNMRVFCFDRCMRKNHTIERQSAELSEVKDRSRSFQNAQEELKTQIKVYQQGIDR